MFAFADSWHMEVSLLSLEEERLQVPNEPYACVCTVDSKDLQELLRYIHSIAESGMHLFSTGLAPDTPRCHYLFGEVTSLVLLQLFSCSENSGGERFTCAYGQRGKYIGHSCNPCESKFSVVVLL